MCSEVLWNQTSDLTSGHVSIRNSSKMSENRKTSHMSLILSGESRCSLTSHMGWSFVSGFIFVKLSSSRQSDLKMSDVIRSRRWRSWWVLGATWVNVLRSGPPVVLVTAVGSFGSHPHLHVLAWLAFPYVGRRICWMLKAFFTFSPLSCICSSVINLADRRLQRRYKQPNNTFCSGCDGSRCAGGRRRPAGVFPKMKLSGISRLHSERAEGPFTDYPALFGCTAEACWGSERARTVRVISLPVWRSPACCHQRRVHSLEFTTFNNDVGVREHWILCMCVLTSCV